jgi:hypothetical protein
MFWRNGNLRIATAVLLAVAVPASGLAGVYTPAGRCLTTTLAAPTSGCKATTKCCCGDAPVRACGCANRDEPTELPLPIKPDENNRVLKWAAGQESSLPEIAPRPLHEAFFAADWLDFAPVERAIQSRLCVWRC